ncbi:MAG: hypothetical protein HOP12_06050, partial [Candidatus Eisenbacteria bacterium]|nr:hypothetical protein [Candidatus Eisenbacteria bacterium]
VMLVPARLIAAGTGAWSPASDWSPTDNYHAVHLALLRGDGNPDHSRVFWWLNDVRVGQTTQFHGGLRGWTPGSDGCGVFPTTFVDRPVTQPSGMNPFCAGLAQLPYPDSGLLVIGGTDADIGDYGDYRTRRFRPAGGTT